MPSQHPSYVSPSSTCQGPFDPDDMELEFDQSSAPSSSGSTPPDTPVHTPLTSYPSVSAFDTTTVLPSRSGLSVNAFPSASLRNKHAVEQTEVFTAYARAKEYAVALATSDEQEGFIVGGRSGCVTPALLLSSAGNTPVHSPDGSRVNSPSPHSPPYSSPSISSPSSSATNSSSSKSQTALSRPTNSLLVTKPFKCPKPNCNKSYKQANGLKYHMTHGSCNFTPSKEGEVVKEGMSDSEVREVEKRLRPYACGVGDCARRYKNMNGLRYHYQHSGEHGALGLALLASGQHECLIGKRGGSVGVKQEQQQPHLTVMNQSQHPDLSQQNFYQPSRHQHPSSSQQPQTYTMPTWGMMNQQ
jgi:transcription factor SFP1